MSHVNAEKTVAGVASAGTAKMMDSAMGKMGMGPMMGGMGSMMNEGMGSMMKGGMGPMMGGMGSMMNEGMGSMMKEGMGPMMGGMGSMMKEGMGPMMGGMGPMMMGGMGSMMKGGMGSMMKTPGVATGVVVYTGSSAGKSVIRKIFTHPLVIFGLGVAAGYYIYKYRKSIISASDEAQQEE